MTTLQLNLPDELAQDVQKFGTLESAEFIQFLESLTNKFKKQTTDTTTPITSKRRLGILPSTLLSTHKNDTINKMIKQNLNP